MKGSFLCWLLLLLAVSYLPVLVISQTSSSNDEPCQSLLGVSNDNPLCSVLDNCTGLRCDQRDGVLNGGSATFVVTKCVDPVAVNLSIALSGGAVDQQTFTENRTAVFTPGSGSVNVSVGMWRNASHLFFQATLPNSGGVVIPQAYVPLDPGDCMCESLDDLADRATHPLLEPECSRNEACNAVSCELDVFGNVYYLEVVIDPCRAALSLLVEDSSRNVLHRSEFNQTGRRPIQIGGFTLQSEVIITKRSYSMDLQAFVEVPIFGRAEVLPQHTIILDKTNCTSAPLNPPPTGPAPVTTPSPPIPPPDSAPETCHAFFSVVTSTRTDSFMCVPLQPCETGISCRLAILDTYYHINISLTLTDDVTFSVEDGANDQLLSAPTGENVSIPLPKPAGGSLKFINIASDVRRTSVSFLLSLLVPDLASSDTTTILTTTLIPLTTIPLRESCQVLRQYAARYSQCTAFSGCLGGQCRLDDSVVSFAVANKCVDPVAVDVSIRSSTTGELNIQRQFLHADHVFVGRTALYVEVGRNATDLQFEATLRQEGSPNVTAVPRATVPLNASECMCSSLEDLASKAGGTSFEPECHTNQQCNGVICEVDLLGSVFYLESIILPCNYAVDVVVRNSQRQPLLMTIYNRTEVHIIDLGFIQINLYVEIVRHPYSMEVSAVTDLFFTNLTLVPYHTIILDKTQCDLPHIVTIAPPTAPPPPTSPPPSAPEICHTFYDIVRTSREPFICKSMKDCETGIQCTLEVLDTFYTVSITVVTEDKAITFTVSDSNGRTLGSATSKNVTIPLPKPQRATLVFNQSVSVEKASFGFSLALLAPGIGSESSRLVSHSLIDYTEFPITNLKADPQRQTAVAVGIAVPVFILVAAVVALLSVLGCMVYCRRRNTVLPPFQFKYKRDIDDLETLDVQPENSEHDADLDEKKLDLGNGSHNDASHYEQPPFD